MRRDEIIAANPLVDFIRSRGHEVIQRGENFVTNGCPVTQHRHGHLCVTIYTRTEKGHELWHCHVCKRGGSVIDWVMMEKNISTADAMRLLSGDKDDSKPGAKLVKTYDYTDENGTLLFQVCRFEPKGFSQRRPDGKGGWIWDLKGVERVLYRLPEVLKAQTVCVPEGEKDCENLRALGFVATTNPMGARKWRKEYAEALRGRDVIVFGDVGDSNGDGEKHTADVIESLIGVAKSVKHAKQPERFRDISDYIVSLKLKGLSKEAIAQTIAQLIEETPLWIPSAKNKHDAAQPSPEKPKKEKAKKENAASQLITFVVDRGGGDNSGRQDASGGRQVGPFSLFHDSHDRPFARYQPKDHVEIWPIESSKFKKILARLYYNKSGRIINRNSLNDAVTTLAGLACHDNPEEPTFLRVAPHGENILIDLCDDRWRVVEVSKTGWQVLEKSPVAFVRTGSMQALPEPRPGGGSIAPLWDLLNVKPEQRPLVIGSLLNAYDPEGPYFVTNYIGEQGTAKTCAARIERQLTDPNVNPLRSPPKEERDLIAQAASNRVVALDNLSYLTPWLSDSICRLATGGGHSARTLYTDLEEISWGGKRPVILNGIEDVAVRPDLAERALQLELEPIKHRIEEKDLWLTFDQVKATIFSGILDGLVCVLQTYKTTKLKSLPRMADAAIWATAGETAFGFKPGAFMAAYQKNLDESALSSVESSLVGLAIVRLFEQSQNDKWQGETSELLEALSALVSEKESNDKHWPKNPRALGHTLRRLAPALRRAGFGVEREKIERRRIIVLTKTCRVEKRTSTTSQTSLFEEKRKKDTSSQNLSRSSHIVSEIGASSLVSLRKDDENDNGDDVDVSFPTLHTSTKPAQKSDERDVGRI